MWDALIFLKEEIDKKTPEDSKELLGNNQIEAPHIEGNKLVWSVYNDTPYGVYVEYWVWWRSYNYHKPKWRVFYNWEWARMFTRAMDENSREIANIIWQ